MTQISLVFGSLFGGLAVVFGAFGAHALKKFLSDEQLKSFETGVKYQLYHAIVLLIIGFNLELISALESFMVYSFIVGVFLFSFSIYGLVISSANHRKLTFLALITPLGGFLLIIGWGLLLVSILDMNQ
jgi:uncharacterized membrane protein YgdD (TMEM256/DUF423 family)